MKTTRIKICGITRSEDAEAAAQAGADALGMVFYAPSKRCIEIAQARVIAEMLPPFITTVALFVDPDPQWVRAVLAEVPVDLLQFHGDEAPEFCTAFGKPYLKALRVRPGGDLLQYASRHRRARGLLLDTYRADQPGGTGECFDWSLIPSSLPLPLVLSGGLRPENIAQAVHQVKPWAVDVSSGVESSPGCKDVALMRAFVQGVRDGELRSA
ncbi:phosphoribosylanthranilate isomerase [Burkholderiales bacterium]|nr:MAG: phosphoribosylanthranilate isomerase [Burkholderiales bacterium]CAG0978276.1 phosphoribosylanthranilate isomerase [Burkholderiales bacterium]